MIILYRKPFYRYPNHLIEYSTFDGRIKEKQIYKHTAPTGLKEWG